MKLFPFTLRWPLAWLRVARDRKFLYAGVGICLFLGALLTVHFKKKFNFVVSDGRGYYVYLPSLVIDGDLDFSNQIREHWDGEGAGFLDLPRTARGLVRNRYPIGLALTLAPSFLIAHVVSLTGHALTGAAWCAPDGYSVPYQVCNLAWLLSLVVWAMCLIDRLLIEAFGFNPLLTAVAIVLFWLGSPLLYYTFREPFMAHAAGLFWVTASIYLVWRLLHEVEKGTLPAAPLTLLAFTSAMALVVRPTNAVMVPFHLYLLVTIVRHGLLGALLRRLPAALLACWPLAAQSLVWHQLYGVWINTRYDVDADCFMWAYPALWQTLFSSKHGLFFWSPLLVIAAGGLAWTLRRLRTKPRILLICYVAALALLWVWNSAWVCWWFGDAFGGRAFLEMSGLFILGLAGAFEAIRHRGPLLRWTFAGSLSLCLVYHFVLMGLYILHFIPRGDYLF